MDLKKMADKASALAAENADTIEGAAETLKDKVVDALPDSVKDKAEALGDTAVSKAAGVTASLIGKAADALDPNAK